MYSSKIEGIVATAGENVILKKLGVNTSKAIEDNIIIIDNRTTIQKSQTHIRHVKLIYKITSQEVFGNQEKKNPIRNRDHNTGKPS